MAATARTWPRYQPGETPPHAIACPFHAGRVWPCPECIAWVAWDPDADPGDDPRPPDAPPARRPRGPRHGGDHRGSAASRRARKTWLLSPDAGFGGDGTTVPCAHRCGAVLTFATVEADRIIPGGPYARHNVQPACRDCNLARSDNLAWTGPALALAA